MMYHEEFSRKAPDSSALASDSDPKLDQQKGCLEELGVFIPLKVHSQNKFHISHLGYLGSATKQVPSAINRNMT